MATYTISSDSSGNGLWVPPYTLADGTYSVKARSVVDGIPGPYGSAVSLTMPNAAKTATTSLIARMSVAPASGRAADMYALVSALMKAGVWAKMDVLYLLAAHDAQAARLNWISALYDLQPYNGPTFTTDQGYAGDGTFAWLDAVGYNPSSTPGMYALNDASIGLWVRTPSAGSGIDAAGIVWMSRRNTGNEWHYRVNDSTSSFGVPGDTAGFYAGDRPSSATKRLLRNGTQIATASVASTSLGARLTLLGTPSSNYSTVQLSAVFAGASLSDAQHAAAYSAIRTYLIALGATS